MSLWTLITGDLVLGYHVNEDWEDEVVRVLTGTLASTVTANGWAGLPTPIPSGSLAA
jgi:hypothetical protein